MKKICLLAAAVSVFAFEAQAQEWNGELRPYIGADYVYSHAKQGSRASEAKENYSSWMINTGIDIGHYTSVEAFFQQAPEVSSRSADGKIKSEFYAYGLDFYGRIPISCSGFSALGSLGMANYNAKYKYDVGSQDKQRIGYRAGVGFSYDFNRSVSFRVMGRYSYIGMANLDNLMEVTAGLRYTF